MTDVFLSYASEDRERARTVARALEESGWSVWWDRKIVAGDAFDQTIERQLESARSVVVLWSHTSVVSEWVRNEATAASERQVLVPALIDDVKIPLEFRRRQTANLIDWDGSPSHEGFRALREGVAARVGAAPVAREVPSSSSQKRHKLPWRRWAMVAAAVAIVAGAWGAYRVWFGAPQRAATTNGDGGPVRGLDVADARVVTPPASEGKGVDNPAPLALGVMHKVTLEQNEEYYFRLTAPANAIEIVQDVHAPKAEKHTLQTELSILDEDGGVARAGVVRVNEFDVGYRKTASFSVKQPSRFGFKLLNAGGAADIWLAVSPPDKTQFFPLFGGIVPQQWIAGKEATGTMEGLEDVYYAVRLPRGEYRVVLDVASPTRERTSLQAYLAVLDAVGGNQNAIIRLNEFDVSYRKVASLPVKSDDPFIIRLQNQNGTVNFGLRIAKPQGS